MFKFILQRWDLSERNVKTELTTEGQYPNSSRNSSGFRTTDSDHILPAATSSSTGTKKKKKEKKSRKFLPVGSHRCVHYALVRTVASWGGGYIHPLVPVTHAMWAAGRNLVTRRRKKFVGMHAAADGRKS